MQVQRKFVEMPDVDGVRRRVSYVELGSPEAEVKSNQTLILLGGAAQSAESFSAHFSSMMRSLKGWRVIIPEFRCQKETDLLTKNATLDVLCSDLEVFIREVNASKPHMLGFSFGGRVALAFASSRPHLMGDLSLTGVSLGRGGLGDLIIEGWLDCLRKGDMRATAWSFVVNGYSRSFLEKHDVKRLRNHVNDIASSADPLKLLDLMEYSHIDDFNNSSYSVERAAQTLSGKRVQICAAEEDRIACAKGSRRLYDVLNEQNDADFLLFERTGHLLPFEKARLWRNSVTSFLLQEEGRRS